MDCRFRYTASIHSVIPVSVAIGESPARVSVLCFVLHRTRSSCAGTKPQKYMRACGGNRHLVLSFCIYLADDSYYARASFPLFRRPKELAAHESNTACVLYRGSYRSPRAALHPMDFPCLAV